MSEEIPDQGFTDGSFEAENCEQEEAFNVCPPPAEKKQVFSDIHIQKTDVIHRQRNRSRSTEFSEIQRRNFRWLAAKLRATVSSSTQEIANADSFQNTPPRSRTDA